MLFTIALSLLLGSALFALIAFGFDPLVGWYRRLADEKTKEVSGHFSELFLTQVSPVPIGHLVTLRVPLTALIVYAITSSWLFTGGACLAVYFAPPWIFRFLKTRRLNHFDEQLVDAVNVLASSARAGLGLVQAIEAVATKMPPPVSEEFGLLHKEYEYGTPIEKVLESARDRLKRPNFSIVATAIIVNREKGGNLVEVLEKIGSSVREIFRLEKKIKTETASVRFSAKLMAAMPLVIGIIFYFIEPSSMELLFRDPVGTVILFFVIVLNVIALVIIRRIVNVEV